MKTFKTIASHRTEYEHPIKLKKGESVTLGERAPEENWKDWIWAENSKGTGGWVPVQLIDFPGDGTRGTVLEDYSARELDVDPGEDILKIRTLNGWTWVRRASDREEGWIPNETLERERRRLPKTTVLERDGAYGKSPSYSGRTVFLPPPSGSFREKGQASSLSSISFITALIRFRVFTPGSTFRSMRFIA